jgi:hypothetical protein
VEEGVEKTYVAETDVFDDGRIDLGAGYDFFQEFVDDAVDGGVFETAFATFG